MNNNNGDEIQNGDYFTGSISIILGLSLFVGSVFAYWILHGGDIEKFEFWTSDNLQWLEILFWSLFTAIVWETTTVSFRLYREEYRKNEFWILVTNSIEKPIISLALVLVITNLGVSFGDTTISLNNVPIFILIAFSIVATYFAKDTVDGLQSIAEWFKEKIKNAFPTGDSRDNADTTIEDDEINNEMANETDSEILANGTANSQNDHGDVSSDENVPEGENILKLIWNKLIER